MLGAKDKISIRQAMLIYIILTYTPSIRFLSGFTAVKAGQAGWLCVAVGMIPILLLITMYQAVYLKYSKESFMEIIIDVLGKYVGYFIVIIYLLGMELYLVTEVRYYAERITVTIYPNVDIRTFIIAILILAVIILRSGLVPIARMSEIILYILVGMFLFFNLLVIKEISIINLTPVSYKDVLPVINGSMGLTGINVTVVFLFMFSDQINGMENLKKMGFRVLLFLIIVQSLTVIVNIGTVGKTMAARSTLLFLIVIKNINIYEIVERLESIFMITWIFADLLSAVIVTYGILKIIKFLFGMSEVKPIINIMVISIYLGSLWVVSNLFELQNILYNVFIYINVIMGFVVPTIIFCVGRIRSKV
ncbi:MAG: endospore germination permease [Eubacteriales bacterium]